MLAQPVLATGVTTPTGNRNLVYVGASTGEFDAFDADSGALVWQKMLPSIRYSCGGTSTATTSVDRAATFDRTTNRIYVEDRHRQHPRVRLGDRNPNRPAGP